MGAMCGGCFSGLSKKENVKYANMAKDKIPSPLVATQEEAMKMERRQSGSFEPSQTNRSPSTPWRWASPAPATPKTPDGRLRSITLEMVMEEAGVSTKPSLATQLDTDGPGRRQIVPGAQRNRSRFEMEQVVASPGTLSKPLSRTEREELIRKLLPTATFEMLERVPEQLLKAPTQDGQVLRRNLARGATLVIVSAGLQGKRFTFERMAALGIKVVIIEHPDSWSAKLVEEGLVAKFLPVDMSQSSEDVFKKSVELIQELGSDGKTGRPDGIATFVELSVPLVARLAERLGLPGARPAAVDAARNKHATRAALKENGLPTPRNMLINTTSDVPTAEKEVGFPAVLKPVSGAASLGVKKVTNSRELHECYGEIVAELKTLVVTSGALVKGDASSGGVDASNMVDLTVLMEQYLDGCEVDVDVVMSDGDWVYAAVADNGPTMEPYFNETWGLCPSLQPRDTQRQLKELAVNAVKAVGFTAGVFHVECKMTSTGPQLIEVNARMGGGQVHECNLRCWGVDLVEETLFCALGIPCRPPVPKQPLSAVAYCYVNAPHSGRVTDLSLLEAMQTRTDVVWAKPLVKPGADVVGPQDGLPTWLCDLFVTKPEAKDALELLFAMEKENPVPVSMGE